MTTTSIIIQVSLTYEGHVGRIKVPMNLQQNQAVLKLVDKISGMLLGRRRAADSRSPPYTSNLKRNFRAVASRPLIAEGLLLYFGILLV